LSHYETTPFKGRAAALSLLSSFLGLTKPAAWSSPTLDATASGSFAARLSVPFSGFTWTLVPGHHQVPTWSLINHSINHPVNHSPLNYNHIPNHHTNISTITPQSPNQSFKPLVTMKSISGHIPSYNQLQPDYRRLVGTSDDYALLVSLFVNIVSDHNPRGH
jgi:hypothetical protein